MADELLPPQDLDAEQALLGSFLLGTFLREALDAGLRPGDFYRDAHGRIAMACLVLAERSEPVDLVSVGSELRRLGLLDEVGGLEYLDRLVRATPFSQNASRYLAIVIEKARLREIAEQAQRLARRAMESGAEAERLNVAWKEIGEALQRRGQTKCDSSAAAAIDAWLSGSALLRTRFSTGLTGLDQLLGGGFLWPGLYLIEAREKRGKSAIAMNIVSSIIDQGGKVGYLAREMNKGATLCRLVGIRGSIPQAALYDGLPCVPDYRRMAEDVLAELREKDAIHIVDVADIDSSMRASAEAIRHFAEVGCQLVVVDNFNNIYADGEGYERHNRVAEELNDLAKTLHLPFLTLCQTSERRGGIQHTQTLQQDCIAHLQLVREIGSTSATLHVRCGREGQEGRVELAGDQRTYEWHESGCGVERDASPSDYEDPYDD